MSRTERKRGVAMVRSEMIRGRRRGPDRWLDRDLQHLPERTTRSDGLSLVRDWEGETGGPPRSRVRRVADKAHTREGLDEAFESTEENAMSSTAGSKVTIHPFTIERCMEVLTVGGPDSGGAGHILAHGAALEIGEGEDWTGRYGRERAWHDALAAALEDRDDVRLVRAGADPGEAGITPLALKTGWGARDAAAEKLGQHVVVLLEAHAWEATLAGAEPEHGHALSHAMRTTRWVHIATAQAPVRAKREYHTSRIEQCMTPVEVALAD